MCTKFTDTPDPVDHGARLRRWKMLWDHYNADTRRQDIPFDVERWVYVSVSVHDGQHYLSVFKTFEDLSSAAGISVLEDGRVPVGAYDLDTCEHVELHVTTPIVSRSEDQGTTVNVLRGER